MNKKIAISCLLLVGAASAYANDAQDSKKVDETHTDVSKNPMTGNTTVTDEHSTELKQGDKTAKATTKKKKKYDKSGKKVSESTESSSHSE